MDDQVLLIPELWTISTFWDYYSNIVLEFRVMPRIWFLNSSSAVLVYGLKYSGLGYGSVLEYTLTPKYGGHQIDLHHRGKAEKLFDRVTSNLAIT